MDSNENKEATLQSLPLFKGPTHECPYLHDRMAANVYAVVSQLDGAAYVSLMNMGFRRSGTVIYRPHCEGCQECAALRVPVDRYRPSRSQRRVWRRNQDVTVEMGRPISTDEKWRLFRDYLDYQHDGSMSDRRDDYEQFLYESPTDTLEMVYRVGHRMVGVGIVDVTPACLSSVYFYFDPASARRSLGVFSAMMEIETCRKKQLSYWYAGYYVSGCKRMNYKAQFQPCEVLGPDARWQSGVD